jgi:tRNA (guanine37-N1)-methyltransferase
MLVQILTLFPAMFHGPFHESVIKRAVDKGLADIRVLDIRDYTHDSHHTADDYQYGGGPGMVMKPGPVFEAVEDALSLFPAEVRGEIPVILLSPQGRLLNQKTAEELSQRPGMVLICGHYEGVDERIRDTLATDDISIGDYVLTGGELPAMVLVDTVVRLIPGVVGSAQSVQEDSITSGLLQHPLYTRPPIYRGLEVPPVLLSGNHAEIARWRRQQALLRTLKGRPGLLDKAGLTQEDFGFLRSHGYEKPV